jgi:hypothetical protein
MIQYKPAGNSYFCRLSLSAQETDETRNLERHGAGTAGWGSIRLGISARGRSRAKSASIFDPAKGALLEAG